LTPKIAADFPDGVANGTGVEAICSFLSCKLLKFVAAVYTAGESLILTLNSPSYLQFELIRTMTSFYNYCVVDVNYYCFELFGATA